MTETESRIFDLFMFVDDEGEAMWEDLRLELLWKSDGGAGLNLNYHDTEEIDIAAVLPLIERARTQRKREADAAKRAMRKK